MSEKNYEKEGFTKISESESHEHYAQQPENPELLPFDYNKALRVDKLCIYTVGNAETEILDEVVVVITGLSGKRVKHPIIIPFHQPEQLLSTINELIGYYNVVWKDAEKPNVDYNIEEALQNAKQNSERKD